MSYLSKYILWIIFLLWTVSLAQAAEKSAITKVQPGNFQVKFSKGYLSVDANNAPLGKIFEDIGKNGSTKVGLEY